MEILTEELLKHSDSSETGIGDKYGVTYCLKNLDLEAIEMVVSNIHSAMEESGFTQNLCNKVYVTEEIQNVITFKSYVENNAFWAKYVESLYVFTIQDLIPIFGGK